MALGAAGTLTLAACGGSSTTSTTHAAEVRITLPALGGDAVLIGVAEMVWDGLLVDPVSMLRPPPDPAPAGPSVRRVTMAG